MKAPNFVPYSFRDAVSGVEAGLHGELAAQSYDECLAVAMFVAAEAPFRRLSFKRLSALQYVADAIPQVRLAEGLNRLDIGITPWLVVKPDGTPFAIVDKRMRMRLTRNLSEEERQAVLNYDFSKMDDCRRNRVSFYLSEYCLPSGDLDLPLLSQEEYHRLKGKCANVREGLALPMLRSDGRQLPIHDIRSGTGIGQGQQLFCALRQGIWIFKTVRIRLKRLQHPVYERDLGLQVSPVILQIQKAPFRHFSDILREQLCGFRGINRRDILQLI